MQHPDIPLPPEPVITRWGTWLNAAEYYCDNFDAVRSVVVAFDSADAESVAVAKQLFDTPEVRTQLSFIKSQFSIIVPVRAIDNTETQGLELSNSLKNVQAVHSVLQKMRAKKYVQKMNAVLE